MYRYRFIEKDFVTNLVKSKSQYITTEDIESMFSASYIWDDLTFSFKVKSNNSYQTYIYDNNLEQEITVDDLNGFGMTFYIQTVKDLTLKLQREKVTDEMKFKTAKKRINEVLYGIAQ